MANPLHDWEQALAALQAKAVQDASFRAEILADPKGTIEKYSETTLPAELNVYAHEMDENNVHIVLPKPVDTSNLELSDEQLELVSGGEFVVGAVVIGAISAVTAGGVGAGITIANDQTKARHGW